MELAHVSELLQRAVRFRAVPSQLTLETNLLHNLLSHLTDRNLLTSSYVDMAIANLVDIICITVLSIGVFEVNIKQHMHRGIRHLLTPEKLTHRRTGSPESDGLRRDAIMRQHILDGLLIALGIHHDDLSVTLHAYWAFLKVLADSLPVAFVQTFGKMNLTDHGRKHMRILKMEIIVRTI